MGKGVSTLLAGLVTAGFALTGGPAHAAPAGDPVSLVVGLRSGGDVVGRLERTVDVVEAAPLTGGLTVDVPAGQVTEAADALRADPAVAYVEPDHVARIAAITPNDPGYAGQWGIARARVADAWATTRGSGAVVVAVVDTGVKALPDLAPRLLPGYDFVNDDTNATDDNGHGTMSAGVVAAGAGNRTGIAGLCWTCKILPVKVLGATGTGSYSDIAEGIRYAADRDADIINLSLGGSADSRLLRDAVAYAAGRGSLVLAAAGNDGSAQPHYPAAIPAVLAIGASTAGDTRYSWSNHGSGWVDLAAPGCGPAQNLKQALVQFCGTSSATPFAAGVAALLASTTPAPSAGTIRAALTSSAARLPGGWVAASSGRVDAAAALRALPFYLPGVVSNAYVGTSVTLSPHVGARSGITRVTARLNGAVAATATRAPWKLTVDTRAVTGPATLTVTATAGTVTRATATIGVTADHTRPVVTVTSGPRAGTRQIRGTARLGVRATDRAGIARLELVVDGRVTARSTAAGHVFAVPTTGHGAALTVRVRAYDRAGNVSSTPARTWYR